MIRPEDHKPPMSGDSLIYRDGRNDVPALRRQIFAAVGLGSLAFGIVAGVAFVWIICNLRFGPPGTTAPPLNWGFPVICSAAGLLLISAMATVAWRKGRKVIVAGICIGIGLCLLCEGICLNRF